MKYWQLYSLFRDHDSLLFEVHAQDRWSAFRDWPERSEELDRSVLDAEIPDEFVREALAKLDWKYFVRSGMLRRYKPDLGFWRFGTPWPWRRLLTAVKAFERYGGTALEDVQEKGCMPLRLIDPKDRPAPRE